MAGSSSPILGSARLITVPSRNTMDEPRMAASMVQRWDEVTGAPSWRTGGVPQRERLPSSRAGRRWLPDARLVGTGQCTRVRPPVTACHVPAWWAYGPAQVAGAAHGASGRPVSAVGGGQCPPHGHLAGVPHPGGCAIVASCTRCLSGAGIGIAGRPARNVAGAGDRAPARSGGGVCAGPGMVRPTRVVRPGIGLPALDCGGCPDPWRSSAPVSSLPPWPSSTGACSSRPGGRVRGS